MIIYSEQYADKLSASLKTNKILAGAIAVIALLVCALLSIFVNPETELLSEILFCVVLCLCGWCVIFLITVRIIPKTYLLQHEKRVLSGPRGQVEGVIKKISEQITLSPHIGGIPVELALSDGESLTVYWGSHLGAFPFEENERVKFQISENFISGYGENSENGN